MQSLPVHTNPTFARSAQHLNIPVQSAEKYMRRNYVQAVSLRIPKTRGHVLRHLEIWKKSFFREKPLPKSPKSNFGLSSKKWQKKGPAFRTRAASEEHFISAPFLY